MSNHLLRSFAPLKGCISGHLDKSGEAIARGVLIRAIGGALRGEFRCRGGNLMVESLIIEHCII